MTVVYLSGPPGVGKSTTAQLLVGLIESRLGFRAIQFDRGTHVRRRLTALDVLAICTHEPVLVIRLTRLFQSAKGGVSPVTALRSLNRAMLAVRRMLMLRAVESIADHHVVLIDEPIWHTLWSQLFPVDRAPCTKQLENTLPRMLPRRSDNAIIVDLGLHRSACRSRISARSGGGRFSSSSDELLLSRFEADTLYDQLRKIVGDAWAGRIAHLSNEGVASPSEVALDAFQAVRDFLGPNGD